MTFQEDRNKSPHEKALEEIQNQNIDNRKLMVTPKMTEENKVRRPCPQCNSETKLQSYPNAQHYECTSCEMELFYDYVDWSVWKEIDRLKAQNQRMREALKYYSKPVFCAACMLNIERGDTAEEALKEVKE